MPTVSRNYSSELSQLAAMREFVGQVCCATWAGDELAVRELLLALQEAGANVIEHAYQGEAGRPITLVLETSAAQIRLTLYHDGRSFDPATAPAPAFDGSREGGFGVFMIERLTDQVVYSREPDGRCAVRLVKNRPPRRQE